MTYQHQKAIHFMHG